MSDTEDNNTEFQIPAGFRISSIDRKVGKIQVVDIYEDGYCE